MGATLVIGSPAYAEGRVSVVIPWEKCHIFITHVNYTKLEGKIKTEHKATINTDSNNKFRFVIWHSLKKKKTDAVLV